jgi:chemotaxis protein MotB
VAGGAKPGGPKVIIKKKGGGHGGHHGGAWKVAYADFVTAMMALFMVLWLVASSDAKARKEIANYFRTGIMPDGDPQQGASQIRPNIVDEAPPPKNTKAGESLEKQANDLGKAIKLMGEVDPRLREVAAQVKVTVTPDGVLIEAVDREGSDSMLFDVSSSKLKPALVSFLEHLAPVLAQNAHPVRVIGHTDARAFARKDGKTNWDLSFDRADQARRVLIGGVQPVRIESIAAYGDTQLKDPEHPYAAANRRLALLVLRTPEEKEADAAASKDAAAAEAKKKAEARAAEEGKFRIGPPIDASQVEHPSDPAAAPAAPAAPSAPAEPAAH